MKNHDYDDAFIDSISRMSIATDLLENPLKGVSIEERARVVRKETEEAINALFRIDRLKECKTRLDALILHKASEEEWKKARREKEL